MLDHFVAKNANAHKVKTYYILAISYFTFHGGKHSIVLSWLGAVHQDAVLTVTGDLEDDLVVQV